MKGIEVGAFEAKNRLSELIALAEKGQKIFITRRGKKVALLVSAEQPVKPGRDNLLESILSFRARAGEGPESLKELIEEGRQ